MFRSCLWPKLTCVLFSTGLTAGQAFAEETSTHPDLIERGRYVVSVSGCNDCHTPGYLMNGGTTPQEQWLIGDSFGWHGPWGTTYASNLRIYFSNLTETQWIEAAKTLRRRPPMPWFNVNMMDEDDLRAIYHFVRSLGDPGEAAPAYLPPDQEPPAPYATFPGPPPGMPG